MKRRVVVGLALVMFALGSAAVARLAGPARDSSVRYETARVERGELVARVTASGTLSPLVTVMVGSQVSGRIQEIFVNFNSPVKKGDVLAKLDPQMFTAAVDQARASKLSAQADLVKAIAMSKNAQLRLQRLREVAAKKLIAEADLDQAESDAAAAKADVAAASAKLSEAAAAMRQSEVNLAFTVILSPIQGVVISRSVDVGQTVAASLQAPTLFTIAEDLRKMQVDTNVAESDVGRLRPGLRAEFTVDAYPGERFAGVVREVRNAPQVVQNVVTYDAVVDVDNSGLKLKPGMTTSVEFIYAERQAVLRLPSSALRFQPESTDQDAAVTATGRSVWLLRDKALKRAQVELGVADGTHVEVLSGVNEGDQVVLDAARDGESGAPRRKLF
ncbi:MAG: efflux RND transporter periplasmic adaptor subunit [Myxococcota bacterium]